MFCERRKKFIKSFSEIKNKENLKCLSYRSLANDVFVSEAFYRVRLS